MKWAYVLGALTFAAILASPPAARAEALEASGPWTLDYDVDSCALRRKFGEGENEAYLEFRRFEPGTDLQTVIATKAMKARRRTQFRYRFSDERKWRKADHTNSLSMGDGFSGVLFFPMFAALEDGIEVSDEEPEEVAEIIRAERKALERDTAANIHSIALRGAFSRELELEFGPLDEPLTAMDDCIDELMTHWDIDIEAHKSLARRAKPINLPSVPRMIDYPPKMIRQGLQGVVNIRLSVDAAGRVSACHIQMPLSDPAFEETSCADIQHALEFDPALDEDGTPIPSYWVTRVLFRMN